MAEEAVGQQVEKKEERPTRPFSKNLTEGGMGRRFFALLVDLAIFMLPSFAISSYGIIPAYTQRAGGSYSGMQEAYSLMAETHLFSLTKSGDDYTGTNYYYFTDTGNSYTPGEGSYSSGDASSIAIDPSGDGYAFYHDMVFYYYTSYLPMGLEGGKYYDTGKIVTYRDADSNSFTTVQQYYDFYYEEILGLPKAADFNAVTGDARSELLGTNYFTYQTDEEGNAITNVQAILRSNHQEDVDKRISTTLTTLNTYFFDATGTAPAGLYAEACNNFVGSSSTKGMAQTYYATASGMYSSESMVAFMFIYFPLLFIVEFVVPMCDKYGRTVGKWIFGLRVCRLLDSGEGVLMTWWQRLMRCLYMTAIFSPLGIFTLAPFILGFLFMVSYLVLLLGKRHQSIHDMFLHTVVVNKKESKIYKNEEEIYDEKMEELAKERANLYRPPEILDLSTINSARELARKYDRFDDIENEDVEVKTYTEYKKPDPVEEKSNENDYFDDMDVDDEDYEDPLGLGDTGPQKKVNPEEVNLTKDDE